jgi:hypothetical protein
MERLTVRCAIDASSSNLYTFSPVQVADGTLKVTVTATQLGFPELAEGSMVRPCNVVRLYEFGNSGNELLVSTLGAGSDPD